MGLQQFKVREIVEQAVNPGLNIPEFQRDFVWDPEQVKLLAESLFRRYPIGTLLLWQHSAYPWAKTAQDASESLTWIVDGQQRVTSLCLLLGRKPYWWPEAAEWNKALERYDVMVNILPDNSDQRLEFALANPVRRKDPRWLSVRDVLRLTKVEELASIAQERAQRLAPECGCDPMELVGKLLARLQALWDIRNQDLPAVTIDHEVEDVAEIFARLNQAGTRVKEADVVLALVAVRNRGWVNSEYLPFRAQLEGQGWDLEAGVIVRTLTGIGAGRARFAEVPQSLWDSAEPNRVWARTKETIAEVLLRLAERGIVSPDLLPSTNSLIPLFVLHDRWKGRPEARFGAALRWFLLANRDGRYSGSAVTSLNEDVRAISEARSFDEAIEALMKRLQVPERVGAEEFLNRYDRAGSRFLRLMLYLSLYRRGAPDWVDGTRIGFDHSGTKVIAGFEPQWHHIFPRNLLRQTGRYDDDEIHALANITVLNAKTNVNRISGKAPALYIKQLGLNRAGSGGLEALRAHLIPEDFVEAAADEARRAQQWSIDRYKDFLLARSQLLAQAVNDLLDELVRA